MQKSPNVAVLAVMVKTTHHQRGAGCSTTSEMRSVSQLKLRRFSTSGTRVISCSASLMVSGTVGAASMSDSKMGNFCQHGPLVRHNRTCHKHGATMQDWVPHSGNLSTKLATPMC